MLAFHSFLSFFYFLDGLSIYFPPYLDSLGEIDPRDQSEKGVCKGSDF